MPTQLISVTGGRRIRPNYVSRINAMTPYLYPMKEAALSRQLEKRRLDLEEEAMARNEEIQRENLAETRKQNRRANLISLGELGLETGFGIAGLSKTGTGTPGSKPSPITTFAKKTGSGLLSAGKEPSTWATGGASALIGRMAGGEDRLKRSLYGAGAGVGLSLLLGGDPYEAALSGILGGTGGLF